MKNFTPLQSGDVIGLAAPAACFDRTKFEKGVKVLKKIGFEVYYRPDIFSQERYLAGTDQRRSEELLELFSRDDIKAILFARGGYGSQRTIPLLDIEKIKKHPKPVVGFSDTTALLTYFRQNAFLPTFYGPVITQLGQNPNSGTIKSLEQALTLKQNRHTFEEGKTLKSGQAKAKLVGGCLSLINSSMGTAYELDTTNSILFLEDVSEKTYVLDRMLTQLKNSGKLAHVKGLIFGSLGFPDTEQNQVQEMLKDVLKDFSGPVVFDFPAGHTDTFLTLPLGAELMLDAEVENRPKFSFL